MPFALPRLSSAEYPFGGSPKNSPVIDRGISKRRLASSSISSVGRFLSGVTCVLGLSLTLCFEGMPASRLLRCHSFARWILAARFSSFSIRMRASIRFLVLPIPAAVSLHFIPLRRYKRRCLISASVHRSPAIVTMLPPPPASTDSPRPGRTEQPCPGRQEQRPH